MSVRAAKRIETRKKQGVCTYCGKRPQFWGQRCILCRQIKTENPLPRGARAALKVYRENEARRSKNDIENRTRDAARELLATGEVENRAAEALRLYVGLDDDGQWRTYGQVGAMMNISAERVRQLLSTSKEVLTLALKNQVPWAGRKNKEDVRRHQHSAVAQPMFVVMSPPTESCCSHPNAPSSQDHAYTYSECGLSNIKLFGLTVIQCENCKALGAIIPLLSELNKSWRELSSYRVRPVCAASI